MVVAPLRKLEDWYQALLESREALCFSYELWEALVGYVGTYRARLLGAEVRSGRCFLGAPLIHF